MIALATRYDVSAHVASSTVADMLPAMCGSDTLTTVVSSTSMNVANMTAIGDDPWVDLGGLPTPPPQAYARDIPSIAATMQSVVTVPSAVFSTSRTALDPDHWRRTRAG